MNRARDHPEMKVKIEVYWLRKRHTSQPGLKVFKSALRFLGHFIFQVSTENTEDGSNLRRLLYSALEKEEKLLVFDLSVLFTVRTCSYFDYITEKLTRFVHNCSAKSFMWTDSSTLTTRDSVYDTIQSRMRKTQIERDHKTQQRQDNMEVMIMKDKKS